MDIRLVVLVLAVCAGLVTAGMSVAVYVAFKITATKSARCFLSPSEICRRFHEQGCSHCEDFACGDNTSPASKLLRQAVNLHVLCEGRFPQLQGEWEKLEDAIRECQGRSPIVRPPQ